MDKLKLMKTFICIVENRNIVKAANALGVTKAAVSKQLIDLENHFKTQLFQRTTRKLKLTDIGKLFYESAKNVFSAVNVAESVFHHTQEVPSGLLRITSHRNFGEQYIVNYLNNFLHLYPHIQIDLELADRFPDLEKENIDILCGVAHEGPEHLVRRKITSGQPILCAAPSYLSKFGTPNKPDDLTSHRYITHSFRNPEDILMFNNDKQIHLDYYMRLNDSRAMMKCAIQGLGFIKIFSYFAEEHIKQGTLVEILKKYREKQKAIYIFYQQQKFLPVKIRVFLDFLYEKVLLVQKNE